MEQLTLYSDEDNKLVNLKKACEWASQYLNRKVSVSNISYLLQYGRIKKYGNNGNPFVNIDELKDYYDSCSKEKQWKEKLNEDIDWHLSFVQYKESERTKHVHRLHPYNDKYNLYPKIAELAGMKIVNLFKRPVLNRVEKDRDTPYTETIFHLKEK